MRNMPRAKIFAVLVAVAVIASLGLWATGAQEAVELRYKWQPEQVLRYQLTGGGSMNTSLLGAPNMPAGPIPMEMEMSMDWHAKVQEVADDGSASVAQTFDRMTMNSTIMNMKTEMSLAEGKVSMTRNGQPAAIPAQQQSSMELLTKPMVMRIAPTGKVLEYKGEMMKALQAMMPGMELGQMMGGGIQGPGMIFPDYAVGPGDTWTQTVKTKMPVLGGMGMSGNFEISATTKYTMMEVETKNGCRIASVKSLTQFEVPAGPLTLVPNAKQPGFKITMTFEKFDGTIQGIHEFDIGQGQIVGGKHNMEMVGHISMVMPGKAAGSGTPPKLEMKIDGQMWMNVKLL